MRILLLVGVLLLIPGCVVVPARRGPPPPPARPMNYNEAVSLGFGFCRSHGYECQLQDAHMTGNNVWKVQFTAFAPGAKGHVHLDYDAFSRSLLRVDEKVKSKKEGGWGDDDRGEHGRGHGWGHN